MAVAFVIFSDGYFKEGKISGKFNFVLSKILGERKF
jgi:hypothetical protein